MFASFVCICSRVLFRVDSGTFATLSPGQLFLQAQRKSASEVELSWCDHLCQDDNTGALTFDDRDVGGEFAVDFHDLDADRHTIVDVHN